MVLYQERSRRSKSGAKYKSAHKKRKRWYGRPSIETKIGEERRKFVRVRGGNIKVKIRSAKYINVAIPEEKVAKKALIKGLEENKASPDLQRRNILTKGAVVKTDLGLVKITSRPGQEGTLNGVLIAKK